MLPANMMQQGVSPTQIVAMLWAYRWWVVAVTFVCVVLSIAASKFWIDKVYESTAVLQFEYQVYDPLTRKEFPSFLAQSYMATQLDILKSRRTMLKAVDQLGWVNDPERTDGYEAGSSGSIQEYLAEQMSKALSVYNGRDSRLVYVTFEDKSPAEAALVANTITEVYVTEQLELGNQPNQARAGQYNAQLEELQSKANNTQQQLSEFRQQHGLLDLGQRADVESERLSELSSRLIDAEAQSQAASLRLQQVGKLRSRAGGGLGSETDILGSQFIQDLKRELTVLETRRSELTETLGRRHPDLIALQAQIEERRSQLEVEIEKFASNIRNQAELAAEREEGLRRAVAKQRQVVLETRRLADQAASLQRELDTADRIYNSALEGYEEIVLGSQGSYSNVNIVSKATPPLKHSRPLARIWAVLAVFVGGMIGVATAIVWELRRRKIRCKDDIERDLGLPVLAELSGAR